MAGQGGQRPVHACVHAQPWQASGQVHWPCPCIVPGQCAASCRPCSHVLLAAPHLDLQAAQEQHQRRARAVLTGSVTVISRTACGRAGLSGTAAVGPSSAREAAGSAAAGGASCGGGSNSGSGSSSPCEPEGSMSPYENRVSALQCWPVGSLAAAGHRTAEAAPVPGRLQVAIGAAAGAPLSLACCWRGPARKGVLEILLVLRCSRVGTGLGAPARAGCRHARAPALSGAKARVLRGSAIALRATEGPLSAGDCLRRVQAMGNGGLWPLACRDTAGPARRLGEESRRSWVGRQGPAGASSPVPARSELPNQQRVLEL